MEIQWLPRQIRLEILCRTLVSKSKYLAYESQSNKKNSKSCASCCWSTCVHLDACRHHLAFLAGYGHWPRPSSYLIWSFLVVVDMVIFWQWTSHSIRGILDMNDNFGWVYPVCCSKCISSFEGLWIRGFHAQTGYHCRKLMSKQSSGHVGPFCRIVSFSGSNSAAYPVWKSGFIGKT